MNRSSKMTGLAVAAIAVAAAGAGVDRFAQATARENAGYADASAAYWRVRVAADRQFGSDLTAAVQAYGRNSPQAAGLAGPLAAAAVRLRLDLASQKAKTPVMTLTEAQSVLQQAAANGGDNGTATADGTAGATTQPTTVPANVPGPDYTGPRGGTYHYTASGRKEYNSGH